MKNRKDATQILIFSIVGVIVTVLIAMISDNVFIYSGTAISLIWTVKSLTYIMNNMSM